MPFTTPVVPSIVTCVAVVLHVPPATGLVNVIDEPIHTCVGPLMVPGVTFTVTGSMAEQLPTV